MNRNAWERVIRKLADQAGCTIQYTGGGHYRLQHTDGWFVFCCSTPGDPRQAEHSIRRDLRRAAGAHANLRKSA